MTGSLELSHLNDGQLCQVERSRLWEDLWQPEGRVAQGRQQIPPILAPEAVRYSLIEFAN